MTKKASPKFSPEVRERAVRMVFEHQGEHASQWAAIGSIAAKIGCTARDAAQLGSAGRARPGPARRADHRRARAASRRWSARTASCARPTRSCARRRRILPRRSSTAGGSHDRLHRRAPRRPRGRADLQGAADRPVDVPRPRRPARRSRDGAGRACRRDAALRGRDPAGLRGELPGLRRAQGLAAAAAGRASRWPAARWRG